MRIITAENFIELKKGDIISIEGSVELVTDVMDYSFYSAPILAVSKYQNEPFRRSSHWAGSLNDDETIMIFESLEEAIGKMVSEHVGLMTFYKNKLSN